MLDEQGLERRFVELEVRHRRAATHGGREDRVGFDAVGELELGPVNARSANEDAGQPLEPGMVAPIR